MKKNPIFSAGGVYNYDGVGEGGPSVAKPGEGGAFVRREG